VLFLAQFECSCQASSSSGFTNSTLIRFSLFFLAQLQAQPYFADPTGYGNRWVADAVQAGFLLLGWARDLKGETHRANYAMLASPDRATFAVIGVGTIARFPFQATWLHTPTADGRSFYTTDKQSGVQRT
jgi:hypothetical protein